MIKFLDLYHQYQSISVEIDSAIQAVIKEAAFIGGPWVSAFEQEFAVYQQANHCVGVANGTDALEIAIESLGLPEESEIIVPANSFIASAEAVTRCRHRVVFSDVNPVSYTLELEDFERRITPRTKAIVAVHLYGHPCNMDGLLALGSQYGLKVIEDCAQAHGAEYRLKRVGAIGTIGAFSFYPGKNLGAYGDAGAILTNDEVLANRCRMIANHGRREKYDHLIEGRNSRLDGLQAAVLSVKLKYLEFWIERRNVIAKRYIEGLAGLPGLTVPAISHDVRHAFHLFVVRVDRRDALRQHLMKAGIETGIHYPVALPKLPAYRYLGQHLEDNWANSMDSEYLSLPIGDHMSELDVERVIEAVRDHLTA